jgi:hypothetical protein
MTQRFDPFFRSRKHLLIKISIIVILASEFFKKEGLRFETVLQGKRGLLGVQLTPTLILADSTGTVYGSWIGQLSPRENRRLDHAETMMMRKAFKAVKGKLMFKLFLLTLVGLTLLVTSP